MAKIDSDLNQGGNNRGNQGVGIPAPGEFTIDLPLIRKRARENLEKGAVTEDYKGDRAAVLRVLNDALATELVCYLRYKRHHFMSASLGGIAGFAITNEFAEHAAQEQAHADMLAERIVQLGGEPDFNPANLTTRSHAEYVAGDNLEAMVESDLIAERIAIDVYTAAIRYIGDKDLTTRRLLEQILAQEEEHAGDLSDFLKRLRVNVRK